MIDFSIKRLGRDIDRGLMLIALAVILVTPDWLYDRMASRIDDPLVVVLVGVLGGGTMYLRGKAAEGAGRAAGAGVPVVVPSILPVDPKDADPSGAGVQP